MPKEGDYLEVEVNLDEADGGGTAWRPAVVVTLDPKVQRFSAIVNGDDDFVEEYGMQDEGTEWSKVAEADLSAEEEIILHAGSPQSKALHQFCD